MKKLAIAVIVVLDVAYGCCSGGPAPRPPEPPPPVPVAPADPDDAGGRGARGGKGGKADAQSCCCALQPTDVGEVIYERLPAHVCARGGRDPTIHDGGACVDEALCR